MPDRERSDLATYISDQAGTPVTITSIDQPTANGFSAANFLLTVKARHLPEKLVVQAAPPQDSALFAHYQIARTFNIQRVLTAQGVPVPNVRWLCEDTSILGTAFYVMDFVAGRIPPDRPSYHKAGWLAEAGADVQSATWLAGIDGMARLHQVNASALPFINAASPSDIAVARLNEWVSFHDSLGEHGDPAFKSALASLGTTVPRMTQLRAHWGDAKPGNMIFTPDGVAAILDWELGGVSTPEEDLAHWFAVDWFLSSSQGIARLPGLPDARTTIAHYEAMSGLPVLDIEWWFAFALVRMALIFQRARSVVQISTGRVPSRPNPLLAYLEPFISGAIWADYIKE